MFIVSIFTLIFTVFTACNYNICLFCSYLHWYSLYLLLVTIIVAYSVPIYIDIPCIYCLQLQLLFIVFLFTLIFAVFTACNYNRSLFCSYLHWYSLYLLLPIYFDPIYIDIHCIVYWHLFVTLYRIYWLYLFIVFLFTLIFTVFTACNYNRGLFCSYLHWYSLYLLLVTIIYVYFVPIYIDIHCIYCLYYNMFIVFLFTLIFTVFTACNYNRCLLCSYLHWYSLYLLLVTIIYVYFVPIYIDIHCIYCL